MLPCSHIGHISRDRNTYSKDTFWNNVMRVADVWLDDYKKHFYARLPNVKPKVILALIAFPKGIANARLACFAFTAFVDSDLTSSAANCWRCEWKKKAARTFEVSRFLMVFEECLSRAAGSWRQARILWICTSFTGDSLLFYCFLIAWLGLFNCMCNLHAERDIHCNIGEFKGRFLRCQKCKNKSLVVRKFYLFLLISYQNNVLLGRCQKRGHLFWMLSKTINMAQRLPSLCCSNIFCKHRAAVQVLYGGKDQMFGRL